MKFLHFIYVCLGTHVIRSPEAVQLSCCSWTARSDLDLTVLGREASAGSPGGRCRLSQGTAGLAGAADRGPDLACGCGCPSGDAAGEGAGGCVEVPEG